MQQEKVKNKKKYFDWAMIFLGMLLAIEFIVLCLYEPMKSNDFSLIHCQKMENEFEVSWGKQTIHTALSCTIDNPSMAPIHIKTVLHKDELGGGDSILFRSRQSGAKVYLDDELIYDSGAAYNYPFLLGYGSFWRNLNLGDNYDGKTLTIELQPLYSLQAVSGYIPDIYFGTQSAFMIMLFKEGFWSLVLTVFLILIGMGLLVYGLILFFKNRISQIFLLGLFSVDTGIWVLMETHILEIFVKNNAILIYLTLSAYGMMPVLLIRFMLSYSEFKDKIYLRLLYLLGCILNIVQLFMAMAGICSQFETQGLNRIYLGLTVVGLLIALSGVRFVEKGKRKLYGGIIVLAVSTILELAYFLLIDKKNSGKILILGICLFIVKSGIDLIREAKSAQRLELERKFLLEMAYTDSITNLGNRYAYDREKNRLGEREDVSVTILVAKVNGLEKVNDKYKEKVICEMADIISNSFKDIGECFRICEKEFCVLGKDIDDLVFDVGIQKMEEALALQEETMVYGVAKGNSKDIEDIFHKASEEF